MARSGIIRIPQLALILALVMTAACGNDPYGNAQIDQPLVKLSDPKADQQLRFLRDCFIRKSEGTFNKFNEPCRGFKNLGEIADQRSTLLREQGLPGDLETWLNHPSANPDMPTTDISVDEYKVKWLEEKDKSKIANAEEIAKKYDKDQKIWIFDNPVSKTLIKFFTSFGRKPAEPKNQSPVSTLPL